MKNKNQQNNVKVSVILLDWSVRESAHSIDYLNNQTVPRNQYEILWIEYYDRQFEEIRARNLKCKKKGNAPAVDKWLVMNMPKEFYYHKHLMYNIGLLYSSGDIIVICDSDGIVRPTFIQSIIEEFSKDPNIVLHMDQLRNFERKYYPFNYPPIDEIEKGSANLLNGKPHGLVYTTDIFHTRNYGGCFCAKRKDIISIGGADEHVDYLGHVCGPYELTFRLVNAGKKEMWHQTEWMYHVWHPGQAGDNNFVGPHDGLMMSTTALSIIKTKRIEPLVENEFIRRVRESGLDNDHQIPLSELIKTIIISERTKQWRIDLGKITKNVFPCHDHKIAVYSLHIENESQKSPSDKIIKRFGSVTVFSINEAHRLINIIIGRDANKTISSDIKEILRLIGITQESILYQKIAKIRNSVSKIR